MWQPESYYWWRSGNAWNSILDYMTLTGDTTYKSDLLTAISKDVGPNLDFVSPRQFYWEANDDQLWWSFVALTALEYNFDPLPCVASNVTYSKCANSWLALVTNAFDVFVKRWNSAASTCGGGLRWQINANSSGFFYKNAISNGHFFQLSARLARYTGNETYAEWATKIWNWSEDIGVISPTYRVYDGVSDANGTNCSDLNVDEWSYNVATYMHGAANMYQYSAGDSSLWEMRVKGLLANAQRTFFGPTSRTPKIILSRWMGKTAVLVPAVSDEIDHLLKLNAVAAAATCNGYNKSTCGMKWYTYAFDNQSDFCLELSALDIVQSLLLPRNAQRPGSLMR
ncbi:hydrolase 76 protein [Gnomoniopsis sp. IMI 355080]|nr:hydrolase 76 protein [Gnomoniopsis sp. IMI 355080]